MELSEISGDKKICGVIGNPLGQSLSPMMHNAGFKELGLNYVYVPFEIPENALANTLIMLKAKGFRGLNITHPFKIKIIDYLDKLDEIAEEIGAVNTIVNNGGTLTGYNTDTYGAMEALSRNGVTIETSGGKILILGAGGAARAVAVPIAKAGKNIIIANRTLKHAEELVDKLNSYTASCSEAISIGEVETVIDTVDIIINCTPVGMKCGPKGIPIPTGLIRNDLIIFDIVYSPRDTPLISAAQNLGAKVIYGYEMLIYQGIKAFELWTGQSAPGDVMKNVVVNELGKQ